MTHPHTDSFKSFKMAEAIIERDFRAGKLTRERASQLLKDARKNYRNQNYNRQIDRLNNA